MNRLAKWRGRGQEGESYAGRAEVLWSCLGALVGISATAATARLDLPRTDQMLITGSFGAAAVLLYAAPSSPLAQPRNLVGGQFLSAVVGVCVYRFVPLPWLAPGLAVAGAIAIMHLSRTLHPPGGATALIAVVGSDELHELGFWYVLTPVTVGTLLLLLVALFVNNLSSQRHYPHRWL